MKISVIILILLFSRYGRAQQFPNLQFSRLSQTGTVGRQGMGPVFAERGGCIYDYDGFRFNNIFRQKEERQIMWGGAEKIAVQHNLIWIRYLDGVGVYNTQTKLFKEFSANTTDAHCKIKDQKASNFFIAPNGQVYLEGGAIYKVNDKLELEEVEQTAKERIQNKVEVVHQGIYTDQSNQNWEIFNYRKIVLYDAAFHIRRVMEPALFKKGRALKIFQDAKGRYFVATWTGLQILDTLTGQTKPVNLNIESPNLIFDICEWKFNDKLWIVLAGGGFIILVDPETMQAKKYTNEFAKDIKTSMGGLEINQLFADDEKILWITSGECINSVIPARQCLQNFYFNKPYQYKRIPFFYGAFNGFSKLNNQYWINNWWGLGAFVVDSTINFVHSYGGKLSKSSTKQDTSLSYFQQIMQLPNGDKLFTSEPYVGLWKKDNTIKCFKDEDYTKTFPLQADVVFKQILPLNETNYLISSIGIVFLFDVEKEQLSRFFDISNSGIVVHRPGYLKKMLMTKNGQLWFLFESALVQIDPQSRKVLQAFTFESDGQNHFATSLASNMIEGINNELYISCKEGILFFDPTKKSFNLINPKEGMPSNINNLILENKNRVWFTNKQLVACFDISTQTCKKFSIDCGFNNPDDGLFMDTITDKMLVGGDGNTLQFKPKELLEANNLTPSVFIKNILIGDSVIAINQQPGNTLFATSFDKSTVTIQAGFKSFNYLHPSMIAWRLSGKDEWKFSKDGSITFYSLSPGNYHLQIAPAFEQGEVDVKNVSNYTFQITSPFYQKTWFYGLLLVAVFSIAFFWYRSIQLQKSKARDLEKRMTELSLNMLQSQMNPHFLFNCLNSIKLYTMENNNAAATEYLSKFSKLMRNMLDASRSEMITLGSELQSLKLYMELEAMRFKNKFRYEIRVNVQVDTEFVEIPPLIIQPFIENAIWHGLMQKIEGGLVLLEIEQPTQNMLKITITDNGIGRKEAAILKSKTTLNHKSHGTIVTAERISLLKEKYGIDAKVTTIDLYDANKNPAGTRVDIQLPLL